jgi:subtilisin-like proprotein convertase family protein
MKKLFLALGTVALVLNASATLTWNSGTLNSIVPDANTNGWVNSHVISGQTGNIQANTLQVTLNLTGGWNGDLFAYLVNSSGGFCVLLDQIGTGPFGNAGNGFNVTLSSAGAGGLGTYMANGSGPVTGNWLPDNTSGSLGTFVNPNGTWSLFIADLSAGGVTTVTSWGLQMDIVAVPEVETWVAAALAGAFGAFWMHRQKLAGGKRSVNSAG